MQAHCLCSGSTASCYGQFSSNLQGTVQDPNGAVIPGATLTLTNSATGVPIRRILERRETFAYVSLAPGGYELSVSA